MWCGLWLFECVCIVWYGAAQDVPASLCVCVCVVKFVCVCACAVKFVCWYSEMEKRRMSVCNEALCVLPSSARCLCVCVCVCVFLSLMCSLEAHDVCACVCVCCFYECVL